MQGQYARLVDRRIRVGEPGHVVWITEFGFYRSARVDSGEEISLFLDNGVKAGALGFGLWEIVLVFGVLTFASVIRTTAGFGFALVAVPPLALILDPVTAVTTAALMSGPLSLWIAAKDRYFIDRKIALTAVLGAISGVPFGVWLLSALDPKFLTALIATVVLACTVLVWRRLKISPSARSMAGISLFAGASFGATGIDGPPMVAAMQGTGLAPRAQRATLSVVFSCTSIASLIGFSLSGSMTGDTGWALVIGVPAFILGIIVGERIFTRFDAERFRKVVLGLLVLSSVSILSSVIAN